MYPPPVYTLVTTTKTWFYHSIVPFFWHELVENVKFCAHDDFFDENMKSRVPTRNFMFSSKKMSKKWLFSRLSDVESSDIITIFCQPAEFGHETRNFSSFSRFPHFFHVFLIFFKFSSFFSSFRHVGQKFHEKSGPVERQWFGSPGKSGKKVKKNAKKRKKTSFFHFFAILLPLYGTHFFMKIIASLRDTFLVFFVSLRVRMIFTKKYVSLREAIK